MIRFFTGLVAGLAIAYLTAPQPGQQTRATLLGFAQDEAQGVKLIRQAVSRVEDALD